MPPFNPCRRRPGVDFASVPAKASSRRRSGGKHDEREPPSTRRRAPLPSGAGCRTVQTRLQARPASHAPWGLMPPGSPALGCLREKSARSPARRLGWTPIGCAPETVPRRHRHTSPLYQRPFPSIAVHSRTVRRGACRHACSARGRRWTRRSALGKSSPRQRSRNANTPRHLRRRGACSGLVVVAAAYAFSGSILLGSMPRSVRTPGSFLASNSPISESS